MEDQLLSVGIDIGTSTTSMVASRLSVRNTAALFTVPHIEITGKEILYRGGIYETPQTGENRIDVDKVSEILKEEYRKAGITPEMVQTGAVIITGESSRKENARLATEYLSRFAGEFVVASAGPDLESVIAGKGSGAQKLSKDRSCVVVNFDIGGGTSNIAVFDRGEVKTQGCYDIGGRLIRVDRGRISYISPRLDHILSECGTWFSVGDTANVMTLRRVTDRMAQILGESVGAITQTTSCKESQTGGSSNIRVPDTIDEITFSGGVADYIYHPSEDWFRHGDIGPLLADSIRTSAWLSGYWMHQAEETIRATVIGAGSYTTTVSGSTVAFSDETIFPMKNIPVFVASVDQEEGLLTGDGEEYLKQAEWFRRESDADNIAFALSHLKDLSYQEVLHLSECMAKAAEALPQGQPLLIVCREDFAKVLGMALMRNIGTERKIVSLDNIYTSSGDYIDFGKPILNGIVVPVVVKTMIFG